MTWSWTSWLPAIRLRMSSALGGGEAPIAFSTARTDAMACTVVQTPQIRWAQIQASRGSLPSRIVSIPRNIVAAAHASVTLPPRTSASMRRWPSMRVTGSILTFGTVAPLVSRRRLRICWRRLSLRGLAAASPAATRAACTIFAAPCATVAAATAPTTASPTVSAVVSAPKPGTLGSRS